MQDLQGQMIPESPRPVHGPRTPVKILLSTKLVKDMKQTLAVCDAFNCTKNSKETGISLFEVKPINMT